MLFRIGIGLLTTCFAAGVFAQGPVRVGVVLSGGGAKGAAHVGFLKALEELGIPIDAMTGASMGALVGGYYAAGWSPLEMDSLLHSEDFNRRSQGQMPVAVGFKRQDPDPSVVEIRFSSEDGWTQDHLIAGLPTDWGLMKDLSGATAAAAADFDQLFVPFRCVASDVLVKEDTTFAAGDLATAVRASMTFPFFLEPVEVDGRLLFDGGLYNNFPSDILFDEFAPDIIIGCNVADAEVKLTAQNPASQIEAMITRPSNLEPLCDAMVIIEPNTGIGTFDFTEVDQAVDSGYAATMARSSELLELIGDVRRSQEEVALLRASWRNEQPPFRVGDVEVLGLNEGQTQYASRLLRRSSGDARSSVLERSLYLMVSDEHIASARPVAAYDTSAQRFDVLVTARSERDLRVEAGGSLSSMPANFGHVGLSYGRFGRIPMSVEASSTFGNFYSAFSAQLRMDWHGSIPFAIRPDFTLHRWNFVRSFSTFFEDVRPSYAVLNEQQFGLTAFTPLGPSSVLWGRAAKLETTDDFYPQFEFNPSDTTERIRWEGVVAGLGMRRSSMPNKGMNREGNRVEWSVNRFSGLTRDWLRDDLGRARQDSSMDSSAFWRLHVEAEQYGSLFGDKLSLGIRAELLLSDESLRRSYMGSILQTMPFQPTQGSSIRILERFRAYHFLSVGGIVDMEMTRKLRWRSELHWFRPFSRIESTGRGPRLDEAVGPGYLMGTWLVAQTPFGLMTLGLEYFQGEVDPLLFEFTLGYRIFNRSDRR